MTIRNMRRTRCSSTIALVVVLATCLLLPTGPSVCDAADGNVGQKADEQQQQQQQPNVENAKIGTADKSNDIVAKPSNNSVSNGSNNKTSAAAAAAADTSANHDVASITSKPKPTAAVVKVVKTDDAADTEKSPKLPEMPEIGHTASLNSGALLRGFYVFVGLSVIALAYMVFRSFRLNKSRTQMVRKYGVLAHKQDIEMRPLPLDEDDEDDTTVFDASGLSLPASSSSSSRLQS